MARSPFSRLYEAVVVPGTGSGWRIASLDGLRGIAALLVLTAHVFQETDGERVDASAIRYWASPIERGGIGGVVLFFALSGFLLYLPWLRATLESRPPPKLKIYALRRCLRIMPAYYASVTAFAVLRILLGGRDPIPPWAIALHFVFLPTLAGSLQTVYWTLQTEEFFYWFLPAIHRVVVRLGAWSTFICACVIGATWLALGYALIDDAHRKLWMEQTPLFLPVFVLGILSAVRWKAEPRFSGRFLFFLGVGGYLVSTPVMRAMTAHAQELTPISGLVMAPFACAAVLGAARGGCSVLEHPILRFLGAISFSLYLWHLAVIRLLPCPSLIAHHFVPRLAFTFVVATGVSLVAFLVVERPFLKMRPQ